MGRVRELFMPEAASPPCEVPVVDTLFWVTEASEIRFKQELMDRLKVRGTIPKAVRLFGFDGGNNVNHALAQLDNEEFQDKGFLGPSFNDWDRASFCDHPTLPKEFSPLNRIHNAKTPSIGVFLPELVVPEFEEPSIETPELSLKKVPRAAQMPIFKLPKGQTMADVTEVVFTFHWRGLGHLPTGSVVQISPASELVDQFGGNI